MTSDYLLYIRNFAQYYLFLSIEVLRKISRVAALNGQMVLVLNKVTNHLMHSI